jgi:hypothetical protein
MTEEHPITPPPKRLKFWEDQHFDEGENYDVMLVQAYQAGADHELEACCHEVQKLYGVGRWLRSIRRPKPPSLKEQAQAELDRLIALIPAEGAMAMAEPIRHALSQLDD